MKEWMDIFMMENVKEKKTLEDFEMEEKAMTN